MNREANFFLVELFCLCPWSPVLAATEFLRLKTECEDEDGDGVDLLGVGEDFLGVGEDFLLRLPPCWGLGPLDGPLDGPRDLGSGEAECVILSPGARLWLPWIITS